MGSCPRDAATLRSRVFRRFCCLLECVSGWCAGFARFAGTLYGFPSRTLTRLPLLFCKDVGIKAGFPAHDQNTVQSTVPPTVTVRSVLKLAGIW